MQIMLFITLVFNLGALYWYAFQGHFSWGNFLGVLLMVAAFAIG